MKENWATVYGFDGYYQVSDLGRVRSVDRVVRCKTCARRYKGKILTPRVITDNYFQVVLAKKGKRSQLTIHRLVATSFVPNPSRKPQVNHIDGNKQNNKSSNLEWCTQLENNIHARANGLYPSVDGENNPRAKLSTSQVIEIRRFADDIKRDVNGLSKKYNVSKGCIYSIIKRKSWKHL